MGGLTPYVFIREHYSGKEVTALVNAIAEATDRNAREDEQRKFIKMLDELHAVSIGEAREIINEGDAQ